jgi:hypothetical protein
MSDKTDIKKREILEALKKSKEWICRSYGRKPPQNINTGNPISTIKTDSSTRITASFELK